MADPVAVTYDFANNTAADADQVDQNFADIVGYLNGRLGNLTNAQVLIADATGKATGRTISGDLAISNLGVAAIQAGVIISSMIADGTIKSGDLSSTAGQEAVATGNLRDNAVTNPKLNDNSVSTGKLQDDAVTSAKIADLAIITALLNNSAVTTAKIADGAVTAPKLSLLPTLTDALAATESIGTSWEDLCSFTPVADASYMVWAHAYFEASTLNTDACNANLRLLVDGAAVMTLDEIQFMGQVCVPIVTPVSPTTTQPIKLQAQREGSKPFDARANNLTRIRALRIG